LKVELNPFKKFDIEIKYDESIDTSQWEAAEIGLSRNRLGFPETAIRNSGSKIMDVNVSTDIDVKIDCLIELSHCLIRIINKIKSEIVCKIKKN